MIPSKMLVAYMRAHRGERLSHAQLIRAVNGYDPMDESDFARLRVTMNRARKRLDAGERIRSIRGVGYMLVEADGQAE